MTVGSVVRRLLSFMSLRLILPSPSSLLCRFVLLSLSARGWAEGKLDAMGNVALRDGFLCSAAVAGKDIRASHPFRKCDMQRVRTVGKESVRLSDCHAIPAISQVFVLSLVCGGSIGSTAVYLLLALVELGTADACLS